MYTIYLTLNVCLIGFIEALQVPNCYCQTHAHGGSIELPTCSFRGTTSIQCSLEVILCYTTQFLMYEFLVKCQVFMKISSSFHSFWQIITDADGIYSHFQHTTIVAVFSLSILMVDYYYYMGVLLFFQLL